MFMQKGAMLYEGKAKKVFATDEPQLVIVEYKDDATAFNGLKKGSIQGKGAINNRLSNHFFRILETEGVPTHYAEELSDRETLVKKVQIVPLEVIIRNITAGSLSKRFGVEEGIVLDTPIFELSYKNDDLGDPMINHSQAIALKFTTKEELEKIESMAMKVNEVLKREFLKANLILVDFKLEFGKTEEGEIVLADEISPDTCRLWDTDTKEKLDKDRFRRDLGGVEEAYIEVARRVLGNE
jgi:phosphoribosylaminoimidazole-succinocarboxamide synthase